MGPLLAVMALAPCSRAARMWSTAGWPVSTFREVASKRTSARAAASQSRMLADCGLDSPLFAAEGGRATQASGSRPPGSAIHPRRREAIPVIRKATPWRSRSSVSRSASRRASVRLTLPKPRKQRLWERMGISSTVFADLAARARCPRDSRRGAGATRLIASATSPHASAAA